MSVRGLFMRVLLGDRRSVALTLLLVFCIRLFQSVTAQHHTPPASLGYAGVMKRLRIWVCSVLLISVFLKNVESSSLFRLGKAAKATSKPQTTTVTVSLPSATTSTTNAPRSTLRPKPVSRRTTRAPTSTTITNAVKASSTSSSSKKKQTEKPSTTTLSPLEIMNRLYQMHGMASHGVSSYSSHSSSVNKKKEAQKTPGSSTASSIEDIYKLHAIALAHGASRNPSTAKPSSNNDSKQGSKFIEHIFQQHSSMPSSMHHIMSQHSQPSSSKRKPEKTNESTGSSLSNFMQPLLKQLTPVGAGLSVVLAPLLLVSGFLQFFSNMSSFLNGFAQTILPNRRPSVGQNIQNPNNFFQSLGQDHLTRQPREWMVHPSNVERIQELTELFMKAMKDAEMH